MRTYRTVLTLALCWSMISLSTAQEQLGLRTENYSGVNSLALNPANGATSKFQWDLNLVGAGFFGQTNYGFVYNTNVGDILSKLPEVDVASNYTSESQFPSNTLIVDSYDNSKKKFVSINSIVMGPSLMINLQSGHSFGVFTNLRTGVSSQNIPSVADYYHFDRTPIRETIPMPAFDVATMVWSEVGINYARRLETATGSLSIGGSIKFLNGYEGGFANNRRDFTLSQLPGDTLDVTSLDFSFGFTTSNEEGTDIRINRNGGGVAFDLGAVVTIDGYGDDYQWKFGAALLDIGRIRFNQNAEYHRVNTDQPFLIPTGDYETVNNLDEAVELFSEQTLSDPALSYESGDFSIWLPGALSLQADYAVTPGVFVNATLIQRLPYRSNVIRRGNLLAVTPRFEHRWLSAALPISIYNYQKMQVGAAVRLAFLTLGTENLGSFIGQSSFTGTDFYIALKVNPFKLGFDFGGGGRRGGKNVKCYEF